MTVGEIVMEIAVLLLVATALWVWWRSRSRGVKSVEQHDLSMLPERFIVFDFETTGLDPTRHEIIEIGAIRVNRDSDDHETFQALVIPKGRITKKITEITGFTRAKLVAEGMPLEQALSEFRNFVGDLPMVAYNAPFDHSFLKMACAKTESEHFKNEVCCALAMARRAFPGRKSYRLIELARDGNLTLDDNHRALSDCHRAMIVYASAARTLGTHR